MDICQLRTLKSVHPTYEERVDVGNIKIDMNSSAYERAVQFLTQVKNPYAFRCGEIEINVAFCPDGKLLKDAITSYLSIQKRMQDSK